MADQRRDQQQNYNPYPTQRQPYGTHSPSAQTPLNQSPAPPARRLPPPAPPRRQQPSPQPIPSPLPRQENPAPQGVPQGLSSYYENAQPSADQNTIALQEPSTQFRKWKLLDAYRRLSPPASNTNALQLLPQSVARSVSPSLTPGYGHGYQRDGARSTDSGPGLRAPTTHLGRSPSPSASAQRVTGAKDAPIIRKILSLDGGGVRGLSTIIILKHIMKILNKKRGFVVDPWQEFDMIGGTSTGGLLAIMLGRLRMSLDECEKKYLQLSEKIFTPARSGGNVVGKGYDLLQANGKFKSEPLESTIQEILVSLRLSVDELLLDNDPESCKVFVCATEGENSSTIVIRSYESDHHDSLIDVVKIWEAARATSAASTFFDPITIGSYGQRFVDGALKHNNPINLVDLESSEIWPRQDRIIISIGTGSAPGGNLLGNLKDLAKKLAKIVTDTEEENELFRRKHQDMVDSQRLYRFNVQQGLADVGLEEHEAKARIAAHTNHYLTRSDTQRDVTACSKTLAEGAQRLDYIGGEDLSAYVARISLNDVMCIVCAHCLKGVPYNKRFYFCQDCIISICERCHGRHDRTHQQYFALCNGIQWETRMQGLLPERRCDHCSQPRKARIECQTCGSNLCLKCFDDRDRQIEWLRAHFTKHRDHREFTHVYPRNWFMLTEYEDACNCINDPQAINHCARCLKPIRIGDTIYDCRSCDIEFGEVQSICESCRIAALESHPSDHIHISYTTALNLDTPDNAPEQIATTIRCAEPRCNEILEDGDQNYHDHSNLLLNLSAAKAEVLHYHHVRKCPRVTFRRIFPQSPDPSKAHCPLCQKFIPFGKVISLCITTGCFVGFCDNCKVLSRRSHRHPLVNCTFVKLNIAASIGNFAKTRCDECFNEYYSKLFIGIRCAECQDWDVCVTCLNKAIMPKKHRRCKGTEWLFYRQQ